MIINGVAARDLNNFISAASILRLCEAVKVQISDPYKNVGRTKLLYNFKIFSVLAFLKIVLLLSASNCIVAYALYVNTAQFNFSTYFISSRKTALRNPSKISTQDAKKLVHT
jgi:hypothetical protein